jgi:hypothetical protein
MIECPECRCFTLQADQQKPEIQCTNCGYVPPQRKRPGTTKAAKKFRRDQDGHLNLYLNPVSLYLWGGKDQEDGFEYVLSFGDHQENKTHFDSEVEACVAALERAKILSEEFLVELAKIEVKNDE